MQKVKSMRVVIVASTRSESLIWHKHLKKIQTNPAIADVADVSICDVAGLLRRRRSGSWFARLWPSLDIQVSRLERYLVDLGGKDLRNLPPVVLVGDRKGCRLIKAFLLRQVESERTGLLLGIRSVVFVHPKSSSRVRQLFFSVIGIAIVSFAFRKMIPHLGLANAMFSQDLGDFVEVVSYLSALAVGVMGLLFSREATSNLGINLSNAEHASLDAEFDEKVGLRGSKRIKGTWPIATARVDNLDLATAEAEDLSNLAEQIVDVPGHPNIYEIDFRKTVYRLEPTSQSSSPANDWGTMEIRKIVKFSEANKVKPHSEAGPFTIFHGTTGNMELLSAPDSNLWDETEKGNFKRKGTPFIYRFWPTPGRTYEVALSIKGGYCPGNMDSHQHPRFDAHYLKIIEILDLRPMLRAGYSLVEPLPSAYFLPAGDPHLEGDCRIFELEGCDGLKNDIDRSTRPAVLLANKSTETELGYFVWEVEDVRNGGLVGWQYTLEAPAAKKAEP